MVRICFHYEPYHSASHSYSSPTYQVPLPFKQHLGLPGCLVGNGGTEKMEWKHLHFPAFGVQSLGGEYELAEWVLGLF